MKLKPFTSVDIPYKGVNIRLFKYKSDVVYTINIPGSHPVISDYHFKNEESALTRAKARINKWR